MRRWSRLVSSISNTHAPLPLDQSAEISLPVSSSQRRLNDGRFRSNHRHSFRVVSGRQKLPAELSEGKLARPECGSPDRRRSVRRPGARQRIL